MTTVAGNICQNLDDIPLFDNKSCISPLVYTILFLTTIILAGITFLLLIVLLLFIYIRRATSSNSKSFRDDQSSLTDISDDGDDDDDTKLLLPKTTQTKKISNVLRTVVDDVSRYDSSQTYDNHNFIIPEDYAPVIRHSNNLLPLPDLPIGRRSQALSDFDEVSVHLASDTQRNSTSSKF
ncbi:unnamed protein product [Adineta ricciae]|uniref:Uncharacterized protein n=1 Tax=Adineta ricciae TaxID=249248 RepID=A0A814F076_ADIRI|nr:unnamed protein product [Adineta ricciae]